MKQRRTLLRHSCITTIAFTTIAVTITIVAVILFEGMDEEGSDSNTPRVAERHCNDADSDWQVAGPLQLQACA